MAVKNTLSTALMAVVSVVVLNSQAVMAQPPQVGTTHTFLDPAFKGTVICDTLDQVRAIATAEAPN